MTVLEYIRQLDAKQFAIFYEYINLLCKCEDCPFYIHCRYGRAYCKEDLPKFLNEDFEIYSQQSPFNQEEMRLKTGGYKNDT